MMRYVKALFFASVLALLVVGATSTSAQVALTRAFNALPSNSYVVVGTGTATATLQGTLTTSVASVCTIADTNETDLWTYTLPANALDANGRGLRVTAIASTAANANGKTIKLYVAGVNVMSSGVLNGTPNAVDWVGWFTVLRTGAATEIGFGQHGIGVNFQAIKNLSMSGDTTAGIIIKVTGQNGVATANDVCVKGASVETLK